MRLHSVWTWTLVSSFVGVRCAPLNASRKGLTFLATGDWGGEDDEHPTTQAQRATSEGMGRVARAMGAEMILLLGDNFYTRGVGAETVWRFEETFENVYRSEGLEAMPFWLVAGNHDHIGDVQLQIAYSAYNPRWNFPAQYYKREWDWVTSSGEPRRVELLMIDTVTLCGNSDSREGGVHRDGGQLAGPEDEQLAHEQWLWLQEKLESSTADFLWVCGHYPLYSAGADGTTLLLVRYLLPMLKAHAAHYLNGHDHMFEHLLYDGVHMVIAGTGSECCYKDSKRFTVPDGALQFMVSGLHGDGTGVGPRAPGEILGGFSSFHFSDDAAHITFHKEDGQPIYTLPPIPRRTLREGVGERSQVPL